MKGILDSDVEPEAEVKAEVENQLFKEDINAENALEKKAKKQALSDKHLVQEKEQEINSQLFEEDLGAEQAAEQVAEQNPTQNQDNKPLDSNDNSLKRVQPSKEDAENEKLLFSDELSTTAKVEALLFASPKPLKIQEIIDFLEEEELSNKHVQECCDSLLRFYQEKGGGFKLIHLKGHGYQFQTVDAVSNLMEKMFSQRPRPLSRAAHETLAIIAYRQPVSRADIEFIRGVDAGSIIKNLLERELIACIGRKENSPGKPMLFGTTDKFLQVYKLASLESLSPLESFQPSQDSIKKALNRIDVKHDIDVEELIKQNTSHPNEANEPSTKPPEETVAKELSV